MTNLSPDIVDKLLENCKTQEDLFGKNGVIKSVVKQLTEKMLELEMDHHLGYKKNDSSGNNSGNSRNGKSSKIIKDNNGEAKIEIPRDRNGTFEPALVPKHKSRINHFDDKIIALYARGLTTRDIQAQIKELYGVDISPTLVSSITDGVLDEVKDWQNRNLDSIYPIVYLDGLSVKIKENSKVINKTVYLAIGINIQGEKDLLGIWINQTEGAKFWLGVLTELQNRGVQDIFIACVDGLTGFPEAIEAAYPKTTVQLCIVHQVRNSLKYVNYKERKEVAQDLKSIYTANTIDSAENALSDFSKKWDKKYPAISKKWLDKWEYLTPYFNYPEEIRRVIYTTNIIESLNHSIRKVIKNKKFFPSDESAVKQIYLGLRNIISRWTMPIQNWGQAMSRFEIEFGDRFPG